jgi:hypothetical protein
VSNLPFIKGAGADVTVNVVEGRVEYVEMRFLQQYSATMLSALTEKYGQPATSRDVQYQNGLGQAFSGVVATWNVPGAVLTYSQYDRSKDWGRVDLISNTYSAQLVQQHESKVQDVKDRL